MRLNVCCGRHILGDGWTNVDVVPSTHPKARGRVPEIIADMRKIPLPDNCADELMCIHGIEHATPWGAEEALIEWRRLLKPGGVLIIECPDLIKCCENLLSGFTLPDKHPDQYSVWGIYGDATTKDEFMLHRYGYTPKTLRALLKKHGFIDIVDAEPKWHAAGRVRRDLRIEAKKP